MKQLIIIVFFSFFCSTASAQFAVDTVRGGSADTSKFEMAKSPWLAMGLSALLPGGGQIYVKQVWKLPIIYGIMGGFAYGAIVQNQRYHTAIDSINNQYARRTLADSNLARRYERSREFYRDDRDKWYIYLGLAYVANILDAYISAHLYDFDVSDPAAAPLRMGYYPTDQGSRFTLEYRIRIP